VYSKNLKLQISVNQTNSQKRAQGDALTMTIDYWTTILTLRDNQKTMTHERDSAQFANFDKQEFSATAEWWSAISDAISCMYAHS